MQRLAGLFCLAFIGFLFSCADPQTQQHTLTTSADSLSQAEGSAEVVKSFLDWYGLQYATLSAIPAIDTTMYITQLRESGRLTGALTTELALFHRQHAAIDPVLLLSDPGRALSAIPACIPTFVSTGGDTEVIGARLAGQELWFTTTRTGGRWLIHSIRKAEAKSTGSAENIDGEWEYTGNSNTYTFSVKIEERGTEIRGWICALADSGKRIDCMLEKDGTSFTGTWDGNTGYLNVISAFSGHTGKATLTLSQGLLQWQLTQDPEGEDYLLTQGLLKKLGS